MYALRWDASWETLCFLVSQRALVDSVQTDSLLTPNRLACYDTYSQLRIELRKLP